MSAHDELLLLYRRIMNHIHEGGNIFYSKERLEAYSLVARLASDVRKEGTQ